MGLYLLVSTIHLIYLLSVDSLYILLSFLYFFLLYLISSTPKFPIPYFYIYILYFPTDYISLSYFFLLNIPLFLIHYTLVVFLLAYVHGLDILLLLLLLFLSNYTILLISFLFLIFFIQKIPFFYILVQILYGTCNSNLYVINFLHHSFKCSPFNISFCNCQSQNYYILKGVFCILIAKAFSPQTIWGFYKNKKKEILYKNFFFFLSC